MQKESKGKILLVDDEEPMLRMLNDVLSNEGYICYMATNAQEARFFLEHHSFGIVLTDILMPGESGLDLCRHIKVAHPDVGVMLITGVDDMATAGEAIELDIFGYILKPVTKPQLLISVANAMKRHYFEAQERDVRKRLEKMVDKKTADLQKINDELRIREMELRETNTALNVLLRKIEQKNEAAEASILENIHKSVLPFLERLRRSHLSENQQLDLELAERHIKEIVSPFIKKISSPAFNLTQTEVQVAGLIKQGMSTKEIAATMNLSVNTIMTHRAHIREKLNLVSEKGSLYSHLSGLE